MQTRDFGTISANPSSMLTFGSLGTSVLIRSIDQTERARSLNVQRLSTGEQFPGSSNPASISFRNTLRADLGNLSGQLAGGVRLDGMISTASSGVSSQMDILQRMRELAISSSSSTTGSAGLAANQTEFDALVEDLDRIATTTSFGGRTLLDGGLAGQLFGLGGLGSPSIAGGFANTRSTALGQAAVVNGTAVAGSLSAGELVINGVDIGSTSSDGVSSTAADASALAVATAINAQTAQTGVTATANATEVNLGAISGGSFASGDLTINGIDIGNVNVLAGDSDAALKDAINAVTAQTGVSADYNPSGELVLSASDGRNIAIAGADPDGTAVLASSPGAGTYSATVSLSSSEAIEIAGTNAADAGFTDGTTAVSTSTNLDTLSVATTADAQNAVQHIDAAIAQLSQIEAELAAASSQLDSSVSSIQAQYDSLSAAEQLAFSVNVASETAALAANDLRLNTQTALLAQSSQLNASLVNRLIEGIFPS